MLVPPKPCLDPHQGRCGQGMGPRLCARQGRVLLQLVQLCPVRIFADQEVATPSPPPGLPFAHSGLDLLPEQPLVQDIVRALLGDLDLSASQPQSCQAQACDLAPQHPQSQAPDAGVDELLRELEPLLEPAPEELRSRSSSQAGHTHKHTGERSWATNIVLLGGLLDLGALNVLPSLLSSPTLRHDPPLQLVPQGFFDALWQLVHVLSCKGTVVQAAMSRSARVQRAKQQRQQSATTAPTTRQTPLTLPASWVFRQKVPLGVLSL